MATNPTQPASSQSSLARLLDAVCVVTLGVLLASSGLQTWLASRNLSANFISPPTWQRLVRVLLGTTDNFKTGEVPFGSIALVLGAVALVTWLLGSAWIARRTRTTFRTSLAAWGWCGWGWWCAIDLWEWTWIAAGAVGWTSLSNLLAASPQLWLAFCLSGWLTTLLCLGAKAEKAPLTLALSPEDGGEGTGRSTTRWLWLACGLYVLVFTTMNWRLYFNLLMPHGDSVMYEEHLWNVLHGKGFRSYLDQGLFFGEHIQFVHLFLLPLYALWPSHLLLELCESSALALGAFPVFWMTRRHSGSDRLALAAAVAYLLYTPMQFLDIEIDLKTFRPEAFGIPLLLLTLDQLERRHLVGTLVGLAMTLTVKEDYAIVFGPLGLWIAGRAVSDQQLAVRQRRIVIGAGLVLSLFSVGYLWLATRVVMPWFRSGGEVHYARYFAKFGETPEQIVRTMVTQPGLLFGELCSTSTLLYALMMLAPLAFLPLFSPSRLAVGLPLFGVLCLNELAKDPRHQFHAPLVAIIFWSLAGGLPRAIRLLSRVPLAAALGRQCSSSAVIDRGLLDRNAKDTGGSKLSPVPPDADVGAALFVRHLMWTSALMTGLFLSLSPLGLPFWDSGSSWFWKTLYGPNRRGELFARVLPLIPRESRVASTDFVHPRFTHHERSYDYSGYARKVAGNKTGVPDDTDFLVIDTNHRYSEIKSADQIPEYRDHPDQWELLPVETDGYFIVLKRKR